MLRIPTVAIRVEPGVWMAVILILAVILVQGFGYRAWQRRYVGDWYSVTLAAGVGVMLVSMGLRSILIGTVGAVGLLALGVYGTFAYFRAEKHDSLHREKPPNE